MKRQASNSSKKRYEQRPEIRFKRFVLSLDPETQKKKKEYANDEKVKKRRGDINRKRSASCRALFSMLKNGELYNKDGAQLSCVHGVVCEEDNGVYYIVTKNNSIKKKHFKDPFDLAEVIPIDNEVSPEDLKFEELCKKFVEGDPEVIKLIKSKKVLTEVENPIMENFNLIKKEIQYRLDGTGSDTSEGEK